jgi:large subunit ribosomal protein L32
MAGKALKDTTNLVKCPGCGQIKRAHLLCPHCVKGEKSGSTARKHLGCW